MTSNINY